MTTLRVYRDEWTALYFQAAIASVCGRAAIPPQQETELLQQTIALCEAAVEVPPSYPPPPDDAPIRAAVTKAVTDMRVEYYRWDEPGSLEECLHASRMWNAMGRHAKKRLATLEADGGFQPGR